MNEPVVDLARAFVQVPSPSGREGALAAAVAAAMADRGLSVRVDPFGNVLGTRRGGRPGPAVLLDAHLDTVPVTEPGRWTHDPHGGDLADGRLWGRGSADTKGALAAMLLAVAGLEDFKGTVTLVASVGEEDLTAAALEAVLAAEPADAVLVGEPTDLRLGVAQKGRAGVRVVAQGRAAHTSRPDLGINAIDRMREALGRIRALPLPADPDLGPGVCEAIEIASEPLPSTGQIPHRCTARLALRLLPGETEAGMLARLGAGLAGLEGLSLEVLELSRPLAAGGTLARREFIPGWRDAHPALTARILAALGTEPFAAPYTTNASAAAARGLPVWLLGPGGIEQAHTVDEWISLDQLKAAPGAYTRAIRACLEGLGGR